MTVEVETMNCRCLNCKGLVPIIGKDLKTCICEKPEFFRASGLSAARAHPPVDEREAEIAKLRNVLEAVRSQMCWERDRDQLTMGMRGLHDLVTKALRGSGGGMA